jgi:2-polyprenyl-3-methyl-5-hydroxy-6-metoxy-1,4-benzoquinol methylase
MVPKQEPDADAPTSGGTCTARGRPEGVRTLYRLAGARWYDPFRTLWQRLTSRAAEAEIDRLVRESAVEGSRVLDIGCGTGYNLDRLRRLGVPFESYRGVDLTDSMLAIARRRHADEARATFVESDLRDLSGTRERFDLILCTWVLSHLEHPREALEIACQLLAPSGRAFFLTLTRPRWYVAWWFTPLVRLFQARYVDPAAWRNLQVPTVTQKWAADMVTLIQLGEGRARSVERRGHTAKTD